MSNERALLGAQGYAVSISAPAVSREMKKSESVLPSLPEVPRDSELPVKIQEEVSERMK